MSRPTRRTPRLAVVVTTVALSLAGCSGETQSTSEPAPRPSSEVTTKAPAPKVSPLTGLNTGRLPDHRAVVVKIENTSSGEPQIGVGSADLVVEELVEGGLTRLAAFYYSSMPRRVGPVRSVRATDIGIAKPAKALVVASGGAPPTMKRVRAAHLRTATEGTPGYYRASSRPAPYNLFMNLRKLPKDRLKGPRPANYLPWGEPKGLGRGKPARRISAEFSAASVTDWSWNGRYWQRRHSRAAKGDDFRPDNVLALRVRQRSAGYTDPAGNPVPESVLTGTGSATLFTEGRAYRATWSKKSLASPLRLLTPQGQKMAVPPGHTWIELIPTSGGSLQYGR
jgi:hypothetical protein